MKKIIILTFLILVYSCSSVKSVNNYSPEDDPNLEFYGKYEFPVSIDNVADFNMTLFINHKKGKLSGSMSLFWIQNQQTFNGIPVYDLKIDNNVVTYKTYGPNRNNEEANFTIYFIDDYQTFQGVLHQVKHPVPEFNDRSYFIEGTKTNFQ